MYLAPKQRRKIQIEDRNLLSGHQSRNEYLRYSASLPNNRVGNCRMELKIFREDDVSNSNIIRGYSTSIPHHYRMRVNGDGWIAANRECRRMPEVRNKLGTLLQPAIEVLSEHQRA